MALCSEDTALWRGAQLWYHRVWGQAGLLWLAPGPAWLLGMNHMALSLIRTDITHQNATDPMRL